MKKILSIALIVLLVGFLFISCGKKDVDKTEPPVVTKEDVAPKPAAVKVEPAPVVPAGDKVVFSLINGAEPESLDPHQIQGVPEHRIYEAIFEGLVAYDPKTALGIPGLAKSWESNADGTQYTFHLRDAVWSDGVEITAYTVVDSWIRGLNPETASPYAWFPAMFIKGAEEYNEGLAGKEAVGIRALDSKTFQMDLVGPLPYAVDALAHYSFAVVPLHAIEKYGSKWTLPENYVGNGPYVLNEWTPQSSIKVVPNPKYRE